MQKREKGGGGRTRPQHCINFVYGDICFNNNLNIL